ncbi:MAG: hypothetical protein H3C27_03910 [Opitutaceae bacterium]|nr:hypothetical protein [Opitutaceae bacterium]
MTTHVAHTSSVQPRSIFGIRISIWAVAIIVTGSLIGAAVEEPLIFIAIGFLGSSALNSYFERNQPKSSRIGGLVMMLLVVVWIVALRVIEAV